MVGVLFFVEQASYIGVTGSKLGGRRLLSGASCFSHLGGGMDKFIIGATPQLFALERRFTSGVMVVKGGGERLLAFLVFVAAAF